MAHSESETSCSERIKKNLVDGNFSIIPIGKKQQLLKEEIHASEVTEVWRIGGERLLRLRSPSGQPGPDSEVPQRPRDGESVASEVSAWKSGIPLAYISKK